MSESAETTSLQSPEAQEQTDQIDRLIDRLAEARAKQLMDYTPFNIAQRAKRQ